MDVMKEEPDLDEETSQLSTLKEEPRVDIKYEDNYDPVSPAIFVSPEMKFLDAVKLEPDSDSEPDPLPDMKHDELAIPTTSPVVLKNEEVEEMLDFAADGVAMSEEHDSFVPRTESNIDVVEETEEREDGVGLTLDEEEEEQTESAFQNRRESRSKNGRKFGKRFDKEHNVDKVITFMQEKERDRKQPGELEYFFASVCESTKHLPRCFQLRVKQDVMKAILNAEMECLGTESSTFSTEFCHQAQPSPAASQSSSEARIATTGYNNQAQENASGLSDGCARSNDSSF
ncbi:hypothetical protein B7P43_G15662 [Cryptotermes secundus]|uniref:BESS domain-containing protein n=1 Tax=Cryptotermes secundus TaxID=105785 RepID=A0A2J7RQW1_9NEOP|nr:uncharacterized protein LOC111863747 isoform X2 [Cryptotermes secundus]PNF43207.1 hypothetical protein B7P43_G15662 [Cryptotermes secundus]